MNFRFILRDLHANIKTWLRSPGTVFWTVLFPILLILIFGAIFSGGDEAEFDIAVQDLDKTTISEEFVANLNNISCINVVELESGKNVTEFMHDEDKPVALVIPKGFNDAMVEYIESQYDPTIEFDDTNLPFNLTLYVDPSDQTTTSILRSIIASVIYQLNMNIAGGESIIGMNEESSVGEDFDYIDFFLPGMIGFTIMTSCIYGSIERNTKYRKDGILRKLLTMPITRAEWILSKMLFMLFLSFVSTLVILLVGILVWGISIKINIFFFLLVIATSFLFSGIGMIIGQFVKEQETADMAGGAITFPMMFLAGTFFPLESMPDFMQSIAQVLPLYYVNEGLRNAMIYADIDKTLFFSAFVLVFAAVFFMAGILLTKWKED
ncbi:MAG: ABC transporter permease [Candidatus Thermoplasmatota archaeon]|nr:ABC transporter permease [Candidatus Thermoplasmatota archaeon]